MDIDIQMTEAEKAVSMAERERVRELLASEGAKIIARKALMILERYDAQQLELSPFTQAKTIVRCQQMRYLLKTEIPAMLNAIVNYEEENKFSIWEWIAKLTKR